MDSPLFVCPLVLLRILSFLSPYPCAKLVVVVGCYLLFVLCNLYVVPCSELISLFDFFAMLLVPLGAVL